MRDKHNQCVAETILEQVDFFSETSKRGVLKKQGMYKYFADELILWKHNDVLATLTNREYNEIKNCMVLCTNDCLQDYHQLKAAGKVFTKEPYYLPIGLAAEFTDKFNNRFMLLEKRGYNDDDI